MNIKQHNQTKWEDLDISNDFLFGKIMQKPDLCMELLKRILPDLQINHIEYPELQKSIKPDIDARSVRLDVYVKDDKEKIYDIEMQICNTGEIPKRSRYYQSMIDLQLIDKGQPYNKLKQSYVIFICLFDIFSKGRCIYTFENICKEDKNIFLRDGTVKIFLNANGTQTDVPHKLKQFLDYVAGKKSENPREANDFFIENLEKAIKEAKQNREWRHEYMTLLMRDQENLEKGREEGRIEGIYAAISMCREFGMPDDTILIKLKEQFHMTENKAKEYLQNANRQ